MKFSDARQEIMLADIVDEALAHDERPIRQAHLRLTLRLDAPETVGIEVMQHMRHVGRCRDRGNRLDHRHLPGGREHGGTPETVSDEQ